MFILGWSLQASSTRPEFRMVCVVVLWERGKPLVRHSLLPHPTLQILLVRQVLWLLVRRRRREVPDLAPLSCTFSRQLWRSLLEFLVAGFVRSWAVILLWHQAMGKVKAHEHLVQRLSVAIRRAILLCVVHSWTVPVSDCSYVCM